MGRGSEMGWAFVVGLLAAFVLFFMFVKDPLPVDPIEAYCRGGADAISAVERFTEEQHDQLEAECNTLTRDGVMVPGAKGPLYPVYE